jgi:hemerythrin-like domain-containing protein
VGQVLDFIRSYADGCHHDKEEKHLFPLLERSGLPREGGPTGVMLREHEMGRELVREMGTAAQGLTAAEAGAGRKFAAAGRRFVDLLTAHIQKEETVLFPMTERVLDPAAAAELEAAFGEVEERVGEAIHTRYREMAAALERAWGV